MSSKLNQPGKVTAGYRGTTQPFQDRLYFCIAYCMIGNMQKRQGAKNIIDKRIDQSDGSIIAMVIWKLPAPTKDKPHGYKFRLTYCLPDGTVLVCFDNHTGKPDHKHIQGKEFPYMFTTPEQVVTDFLKDIKDNGGHYDG